MCEVLRDFREALAGYARRFDAALLSSGDASAVAAEAASIEHIAATLKSLAAARAAQGPEWRRAGYRSPTEALARQAGMSMGAARDALETGRRLEAHPVLDRAARSGGLSAAQSSLIADAVDCEAGCAPRLIDMAGRCSLAELRDEVGRVKAAATADPEARRREIRARRGLRAWSDTEGVWHLQGRGNPEDGAQIMAAVGPLADARFAEARAQGRREPPEAYAFDALVDLAVDATSPHDAPAPRHGGGAGEGPAVGCDPDPARPPGEQNRAGEQHRAGGAAAGRISVFDPPAGPPAPCGDPPPDPPPPEPLSPDLPAGGGRRRRRGAPVKLLVRVDYDSLLRGVVAPGETCELVGYGPVAVSVVEELIERGDPFVAAILTRAKKVVGVAHLGRQPTAHQQSALEWLYPTCAAQGCAARARLERDHREDWAHTHVTVLDLLDLLCSHHHGLKTREGWSLVAGTGKRPFVSPDDPRHHPGSRPGAVGPPGRGGAGPRNPGPSNPSPRADSHPAGHRAHNPPVPAPAQAPPPAA